MDRTTNRIIAGFLLGGLSGTAETVHLWLIGASAKADTGRLTILCGDAVTTNLTIRRGQRVRVAHEACPHGGAPLDAYWARVNSLFDVLAKAAQ